MKKLRRIQWLIRAKRIGLTLLFGAAISACSSSDDFIACQQAVASGSVMVGSGLAGDPAIPEPQSGYKLGKSRPLP